MISQKAREPGDDDSMVVKIAATAESNPKITV
jgi:hypothetical protein